MPSYPTPQKRPDSGVWCDIKKVQILYYHPAASWNTYIVPARSRSPANVLAIPWPTELYLTPHSPTMKSPLVPGDKCEKNIESKNSSVDR